MWRVGAPDVSAWALAAADADLGVVLGRRPPPREFPRIAKNRIAILKFFGLFPIRDFVIKFAEQII